jgi:4-amino-4-deoxy-L-arabinose transferase-like glycosyltransferase
LDLIEMNILQRNTLSQYLTYSSKWFLQSRPFLIVLTGLHLLWLAAIGLSGANTNWSRLLFLLMFSVLAGASVVFLPSSVLSKLVGFKEWLLQEEKRIFFVLGLAALVFGLVYAFYQRMWPNEKSIFNASQMVAAEGLQGIATAYSKMSMLRYQHPPLIPLMFGTTLSLLGVNLIFLRLVSVCFLIATVILTYLIGRRLYNRETGLLAALFFLFFPLTIRLGAAALMDIELAFFFCLALLLSFRLLRKPSYGLAVILGCVIGLGLLTKYIMGIFYFVLLAYFIINPSFRKLKGQLAVAILVSACLFAVWIVYAFQAGYLSSQVDRILNVSGVYQLVRGIGGEETAPVVSDLQTPAEESIDAEEDSANPVRRSDIVQLGLESLFTRLPSSLGVHFIPLLLMGAIYLIRRRTQSDWFVLLWIGVMCSILILTLPGHRYFLATFPAMAIVIARFFSRNREITERAILLSLLFSIAAMVLYVDWARESTIFIAPPS